MCHNKMLLYICYNSNSILLNILIFLYYSQFKMMINNIHYIFICWHFKNAYIIVNHFLSFLLLNTWHEALLSGEGNSVHSHMLSDPRTSK